MYFDLIAYYPNACTFVEDTSIMRPILHSFEWARENVPVLALVYLVLTDHAGELISPHCRLLREKVFPCDWVDLVRSSVFAIYQSSRHNWSQWARQCGV